MIEIDGRWLEAHPPFDCKLCGKHQPHSEFAYNQKGVCGPCTRDLADDYHYAHSGEYFFKPNPPRPARYTKKPIKNALRLKVYERDGFKCVYCGARKNLSCDHVTPESKGGETAIGNLVTACRTCNSRKKAKSLQDFWEAR